MLQQRKSNMDPFGFTHQCIDWFADITINNIQYDNKIGCLYHKIYIKKNMSEHNWFVSNQVPEGSGW